VDAPATDNDHREDHREAHVHFSPGRLQPAALSALAPTADSLRARYVAASRTGSPADRLRALLSSAAYAACTQSSTGDTNCGSSGGGGGFRGLLAPSMRTIAGADMGGGTGPGAGEASASRGAPSRPMAIATRATQYNMPDLALFMALSNQ
jgi:hypothetical protein